MEHVFLILGHEICCPDMQEIFGQVSPYALPINLDDMRHGSYIVDSIFAEGNTFLHRVIADHIASKGLEQDQHRVFVTWPAGTPEPQCRPFAGDVQITFIPIPAECLAGVYQVMGYAFDKMRPVLYPPEMGEPVLYNYILRVLLDSTRSVSYDIGYVTERFGLKEKDDLTHAMPFAFVTKSTNARIQELIIPLHGACFGITGALTLLDRLNENHYYSDYVGGNDVRSYVPFNGDVFTVSVCSLHKWIRQYNDGYGGFHAVDVIDSNQNLEVQRLSSPKILRGACGVDSLKHDMPERKVMEARFIACRQLVMEQTWFNQIPESMLRNVVNLEHTKTTNLYYEDLIQTSTSLTIDWAKGYYITSVGNASLAAILSYGNQSFEVFWHYRINELCNIWCNWLKPFLGGRNRTPRIESRLITAESIQQYVGINPVCAAQITADQAASYARAWSLVEKEFTDKSYPLAIVHGNMGLHNIRYDSFTRDIQLGFPRPLSKPIPACPDVDLEDEWNYDARSNAVDAACEDALFYGPVWFDMGAVYLSLVKAATLGAGTTRAVSAESIASQLFLACYNQLVMVESVAKVKRMLWAYAGIHLFAEFRAGDRWNNIWSMWQFQEERNG